MIDCVEFAYQDDVRSAFIVPDGSGGWRNLGEHEAEEVFLSYGVGIEHVSEIMRSRGLW